jgi:hypothetical protein
MDYILEKKREIKKKNLEHIKISIMTSTIQSKKSWYE